MFMATHLCGFGSGGGGSASVAFTDSSIDDTNATTYTFTSQALGTAASNRKIVVAANAHTDLGADPVTVSSMTVAGIAASLVVRHQNADRTVELWQADVPTGTTGDIVVNLSASSPKRAAIGVWAVYGAQSAAHDTGTSAANPLTDTLNIPAGGVAIGAAQSANSTFTWTNLTEDFDDTLESFGQHSGASAAFATIQTGLAITATQSNNSSPGLVLASWGPA